LFSDFNSSAIICSLFLYGQQDNIKVVKNFLIASITPLKFSFYSGHLRQ